ncbi:MAG: hypothetical protein MJ249_05080 [Kiritimatiellae bacterium]|nr:hypothetical protein [Kiritimatiellia bacterium]
MKKRNNATDTDRGRTAKTPNPAAEAWRRLQAEALLRRCGYVELPGGKWIDPTDQNDKGLKLG